LALRTCDAAARRLNSLGIFEDTDDSVELHGMGSPSQRDHALDATRAFALLLGVAFHAAWSFVPYPFDAPIMDMRGGHGLGFFFFTSHTFRMQLFFLIAGFFARLLYHRRGLAGFSKNRLIRIAIPLLIGWIVLYPLGIMWWIVGGNASGRNLTAIPLRIFFAQVYGYGLVFVERKNGGMFSLGHLWFLYYLLLIYILFIGAYLVIKRVVPNGVALSERADRMTARCMSSPWSVLPLSLATGLFLWPMDGWFGVDPPSRTIRPSIPVLIIYAMFFVIGWLLNRQPRLVASFPHRWKWQVPLGLAISVALYSGYQRLYWMSIASSPLTSYPMLTASQISDWPRFLTTLKSAESDGPAELKQVWAAISPTTNRDVIRGMSSDASLEVRTGVCGTMNKLIAQPGLFSGGDAGAGGSPIAHTLLENRRILERLLAGSLAHDPREISWFWPVKLVYSIAYGMVMWLFVFGSLSFFQDRCPAHNPTWRYVADSSYWIYLAHLPPVYALQVWVATWPTPGVVKFTFICLAVTVLLLASYHYLVRSTLIGLVLNGRRYPFVAWPFGIRHALEPVVTAEPVVTP
jgi:peptidoglycan/LPS O-acetylase OafA/YrhL